MPVDRRLSLALELGAINATIESMVKRREEILRECPDLDIPDTPKPKLSIRVYGKDKTACEELKRQIERGLRDERIPEFETEARGFVPRRCVLPPNPSKEDRKWIAELGDGRFDPDWFMMKPIRILTRDDRIEWI